MGERHMQHRNAKLGRYVLGGIFVVLSLLQFVVLLPAPCPPPGGKVTHVLFGVTYLWIGVRTALLPPTRRFAVISALVISALLALMLGLALRNPNPPCDAERRSTTWYLAAVAAVH
jgi:hypothetical protein